MTVYPASFGVKEKFFPVGNFSTAVSFGRVKLMFM